MAEIVYEVVQDDIELMNTAALCLKHKLYVSGWTLSNDLTLIKAGRTLVGRRIVLAKDGETPVGVCVKTPSGFLQVFVRKSYRYQGIGSELIRLSKAKPDEYLHAGDGVVGSIHFFSKNNVDVPY